MIPEYVLYQRLAQDATLLQLVDGRIMPPPRPQTGPDARLPAVVYQRVGGDRYHEHTAPSSFGRVRVQYSAFAQTDTTAWAVAIAIRKAVDGWSDRTTTPNIQGVTVESPLYRYEDDAKLHHVMIDAFARYAD